MKINPTSSDQLYNWSFYEILFCRSIAPTTLCPGCANCSNPEGNTSRIPHRTLQALWQAWLPVRSKQRSWTQILLVSQLSGQKTANGLCASGSTAPGAPICQKPSTNPRVARTNKSHQPGTLATQGNLLTENARFHPLRFGFGATESDCCQYARMLSQGGAIPHQNNPSNFRRPQPHVQRSSHPITEHPIQPTEFDL